MESGDLSVKKIGEEIEGDFYKVSGIIKREHDSRHFDIVTVVENKEDDEWRLDNIKVDGKQHDVDGRRLWGDVGDSWDFKKTIIDADGVPPKPREKGVKGTEPDSANDLEIDFMTFNDRWDHQIEHYEPDEFISEDEIKSMEISDYEAIYAKHGLVAETNLFDWLIVEVSSDYETDELRYIALEWENVSETNYTLIMQAIWTLIFITSDLEASELTSNVSQELGITDLDGYFVNEYEFIGNESIIEYEGIEYDLYSSDAWGEFIISVSD
ncbi:hypothetical protein [Natranaerofaba carboxydovora]|uniref:hypothetical protein n=1 Tax=Natranaerofaba carboxydovora TaxID=2742683 RepID=UPI001F13181E|nr:hypothetical protein [Natranaerofaba carboxydovora]UMZ73104.1 hypothetical protein ACONDI_00655 [Natranaerofaba carboxydovora]